LDEEPAYGPRCGVLNFSNYLAERTHGPKSAER
jgi:hypothetical protein